MGAVQFLGFTGRPQVDFYTIDLKDGNKDPWLSQMHYTLNIGWNRGFDGIAGIEVEELAYIRPLRPEEELERLGRLALLPPSVMVVRLGADAQAVVAAERIMETRADEAIVVFLCSDNGSERVASNILERWVGRVSFDGSKVRAGVDSNTVTGAGASCLTDDAGVLCLFIRERNISWFPRPNLPSTVVKMPSPASDVQAALEFADLACKRWDRCNTKAVLSDATWRKIARELPSHPRPPLAPKLLFDWSSPSVVVDDARRVISIEGMKTVGILRQVLTGHIVSAKGGRRMLLDLHIGASNENWMATLGETDLVSMRASSSTYSIKTAERPAPGFGAWKFVSSSGKVRDGTVERLPKWINSGEKLKWADLTSLGSVSGELA